MGQWFFHIDGGDDMAFTTDSAGKAQISLEIDKICCCDVGYAR